MREKLITLIQNAVGDCARYWASLIADKLLSEGVIVPKVKIGDTLYAINAALTRVNKYIVTHLEMYECGIKIFGRQIYCREEYWLCWSQDLGNDECCIFLTREEAEKALAEIEGAK
jgi:hypothetical protein